MSEPLLKVSNLTRLFGSGGQALAAVNQVSFSLEPGEIV